MNWFVTLGIGTVLWVVITVGWRLVDRLVPTQPHTPPLSVRLSSAPVRHVFGYACFLLVAALLALALQLQRPKDMTGAILLGALFGITPAAFGLALALRSRSFRDGLRSVVFYLSLIGCAMLLYTVRR